MGANARGAELVGSAGTGWLRERGWTLRAYARPFQLYADELQAARCTIRRAYFAPLRATHAVVPTEENAMLQVTHIVSGSSRVVALDGVAREAEAGSTFVRSEGQSFSIECLEPVAVIQIMIDPALLALPGPARGIDRFVGRNAAIAAVFRSLVATLFDCGLGAADAEFAAAQTAMVAILQGLLDLDPLADRAAVTLAEATILERAREYIRLHAHEQDLTIAEILSAVNVSRSYLFRVFARAGSTPLRYLSDVRTARARQELASLSERRPGAVKEIARRNGFATPRSLRHALARAS